MNPPPLPRAQRTVDQEHLRLLAIFHFVIAGFAVLGIGFLFLHYHIFKSLIDSGVFNDPHGKGPVFIPQFFEAFQWFYVAMGFVTVLSGIGNLLSGLFLQRRQHRIFSIVVAALDCLQVPFGTALGVFTIIVLMRESTISLYADKSS